MRLTDGRSRWGHSEVDIRYVRRRYLTAEVSRAIAVEVANATFAARAVTAWGAGTGGRAALCSASR